jgi:hypothetical protein
MKKVIFFLSLSMALFTTACSKSEAESVEPITNQQVTPPQGVDSIAFNIAKRFTDAMNAGSADNTKNTLRDDAIFDSVGRIYNGANDIMNRFLVPEVINPGGQYEIVRASMNPETRNLRIEYNFRTRSYSEKFYYEYTIREGRIAFVLGRYL